MKPNSLLAITLALALVGVCERTAPGQERPFGLAAAQADVKKFTVANTMEVTLFAAEPMLVNPTSIDIDHLGRVWVCEGANYRGVRRSGGDRIVILEDTNGDGLADKQTVFYQGMDVNAAQGICVLGNKAIISCSPSVFVLTDDDGDGKADKKEVLFTDGSMGNHDHGMHSFVFGPDGKLYFTMGNVTKQLRNKHGQPIIDMAGNEVSAFARKPYQEGMVLRCSTDGSEVETLGWNFRNNYEVAVDSYGTVWLSDNDEDGTSANRINYVMEFGNYGLRDEKTGASWLVRRIGQEKEYFRYQWHQNDPGVVPDLIYTGGGAPAGMTVYDGNVLAIAIRGQMIHCDAGMREVLTYPKRPAGAGYTVEIVSLLSTEDTWFRPTDVCVAPDGSLIVADWNDGAMGGGSVMDNNLERMTGRLYRIAPPGQKPVGTKFDFKTASSCVQALQSPNLATRYLAWTKLNELQSAAEAELLKLWNGTEQRERARALQLLARIKGSGQKYVDLALKDTNSDIRITGLRIARALKLDIIPLVEKLVKDASPQVRRECAIALRGHKSPDAPKLWAQLALQHDAQDRWYLEALGIGAAGQDEKFFAAWQALVGSNWNTPAGRDIVWRIRSNEASPPLLLQLIGAALPDRSRYIRALDFLEGPAREKALQSDLVQTARQTEPVSSERKVAEVDAFLLLPPEVVKTNLDRQIFLAAVLKDLRGTSQYTRLIERFGNPGENPILLAIAVSNPNAENGVNSMRTVLESGDINPIKSALDGESALNTVTVLGNTGHKLATPLLSGVAMDTKQPAPVRLQAVRSLAQSKSSATALLSMLKVGSLANELRATAISALHHSTFDDIREEAMKFFPIQSSPGSTALPNVSTLLKQSGSAANGALVFRRESVGCINCHQINAEGKDLGPAQTEIGTKLGKDALYQSILEPSAGISTGFEAWQIELSNGDEYYGLIVNETDSEVTIKDARAIPLPLKKSEIIKRTKSKLSIMPSGLHQSLTIQELVDLVEYLASLKKR